MGYRELKEEGLIVLKVYCVVPPHIEYALSLLGESLNPVIESMRTYGAYY